MRSVSVQFEVCWLRAQRRQVGRGEVTHLWSTVGVHSPCWEGGPLSRASCRWPLFRGPTERKETPLQSFKTRPASPPPPSPPSLFPSFSHRTRFRSESVTSLFPNFVASLSSLFSVRLLFAGIAGALLVQKSQIPSFTT